MIDPTHSFRMTRPLKQSFLHLIPERLLKQ
jgi:hypothetical protein